MRCVVACGSGQAVWEVDLDGGARRGVVWPGQGCHTREDKLLIFRRPHLADGRKLNFYQSSL
jgi:hypothetical protein